MPVDPLTMQVGMTAGGALLGAYSKSKEKEAQEERDREISRQAYLQNMNEADKVRLSTWLPNQGQGIKSRAAAIPEASASPWMGALQGGFAGLSQGMEINSAINQNEMLKAKTAEANANAKKTLKDLGKTPDDVEKFVAETSGKSAPSPNYPTPKHISQGLNPQGNPLMDKQLPQMQSSLVGDKTHGKPRDPYAPVGNPWDFPTSQFSQYNKF